MSVRRSESIANSWKAYLPLIAVPVNNWKENGDQSMPFQSTGKHLQSIKLEHQAGEQGDIGFEP